MARSRGKVEERERGEEAPREREVRLGTPTSKASRGKNLRDLRTKEERGVSRGNP